MSRREFLQRTAVAGLATATGTWFWQRPAFGQAVPVEQLHGQFGSDAGREAAFSWMTPGAVDGPFLQLGGERIPAESLQYDGYPGWFHHVRVDDLLPATEYRYA
ncbi:MAG: fibronectin type III domain-containing protein, partial [Nitriliruptorales bacterium]|nr:fibronectin type III domain-containing protein [Nitriliruptorales bacterium]